MRIYTKNGRYYMSVTSIIDLMYGYDEEGFNIFAYKNNISPDWINKESRDRGDKYHAYFENRAYGIKWADVCSDKKDIGYMKAVDKFFQDGWKLESCEQVVYNDKYHFAGKYDSIAVKNKLKYLADVKTWGAWNGRLYKQDQLKIAKVSNQLTMYNSCLKKQLPLLLVVPQFNGEYVVENLEPNYDWVKFLDKNKSSINAIIEDYKNNYKPD